MLEKARVQQWRPSVAKIKWNKNSHPTTPNFFSGAFFPIKVTSGGACGGGGVGVEGQTEIGWISCCYLWCEWSRSFFFFFNKNMLVKTGGGRGGLIIVSQWKWLTYLQHGGKVQLQDLELCIYWPGWGSVVHISGWAGHFVHRKMLQDTRFTVNS